ncbi:Pachytene checkpoint protein 2-like protein [Trichoplax sp. H2]|nr:Pachytene checkpoint protein 2-like protein [Trichoplax sp. H2]|eukprot:RDD47280.1 Pachytene checkpoint protein 2-like protein [Trichoplax sp. H2]
MGKSDYLSTLKDSSELQNIYDSLPVINAQSAYFEVIQKIDSHAISDEIESRVRAILLQLDKISTEFELEQFQDDFLTDNIESIKISDMGASYQMVNLTNCKIIINVFQLHQDEPADEGLNDDDENIVAARHWILPSTYLHDTWDSLIYEDNIKAKLLSYISTTLLFSDKKVNQDLINWNRIVLLHGPPGTGKTSLCKALAHKLTIRFSKRYKYGQLIEINSHSLFSKWFSESGKLVMKMFQKIQELVDDSDALVCLLIDEVESLTAARSAALNGTEPSDAIRVVNALLTQLDRIKSYPNVVILTTSNITDAIDLAFVDRADIKQFIGLPSVSATMSIHCASLNELMRVGIITPPKLLIDNSSTKDETAKLSQKLLEVARLCKGRSGRYLKKLPFLAHALAIQSATCNIKDFIDAMSKTIEQADGEKDLFTTS